MTGIRVVIGLIIGGIVFVALMPMFVLVDLAGGGTGLGICPDGLSSCRTSYFDGPELLAGIVVIIFLLVMLLRATVHASRIVEARRRRDALDPVLGGHDRLRSR